MPKKPSKRQQNIQGNIQSGNLSTLDQGSPITQSDLQGFLGKGGKVTVNPFTGKEIKQKDKLNVNQFLAQNNPSNIDTEFEFEDLPTVGGENSSGSGIRNQANQINQQAQSAIQGGSALSGAGVDILKGLLGQIGGEVQNIGTTRASDRLGATRFEEGALDPRLSQGTQDFLSVQAEARLADAREAFGEGGAAQKQLAKDLSFGVADIDQFGVSGTSEANLLRGLIGNFNESKAAAIRDANETSRLQEQGERNALRDLSQSFAGNRLSSANAANQALSNLLGLSVGAGGDILQGGIAQQNIGTNLANLGLEGLSTSLTQDRADRTLEAELQQGEKAFQTDLLQQFLDNERISKEIKRNKNLENILKEVLGDLL